MSVLAFFTGTWVIDEKPNQEDTTGKATYLYPCTLEGISAGWTVSSTRLLLLHRQPWGVALLIFYFSELPEIWKVKILSLLEGSVQLLTVDTQQMFQRSKLTESRINPVWYCRVTTKIKTTHCVFLKTKDKLWRILLWKKCAWWYNIDEGINSLDLI